MIVQIRYSFLMQSPPLKEKPDAPHVVLPVPRNKGIAALFVLVPMVVVGGMGALAGGLMWRVTGADVLRVCTALGLALGALLGVYTLFMVLSYDATHVRKE